MKTTTDGLVIWETKTGEADRVITLLTPDGVVTAYAKNSLRPKNKLTSPTAMLSYSNFELYEGKNMYTVDDANIRHRFVKLFSNARGYALAVYFCELLKLLAPIEDDARAFVSLSMNALHFLNDESREPGLIKCVFELRIAAYAGYLPDVAACRDCGDDTACDGYLDIVEGTLLCGRCAAKLAKQPNVSRAVVRAMRHIVGGSLAQAFSFTVGERSKAILYAASEQYMLARLERGLATLDFYKTIST